MNTENKEMVDELRKFVIETAKNAGSAASSQLEAMTKAAELILRLG